MPDYSFMRSGLSDDYNPVNAFSIQDLEILLAVFVKNSIKNASRHVKICGRSGVTKKDMELGLKYEVFDFFQNPDNVGEIQQFRAEAEAAGESEEEEFIECECPCTCDCKCEAENSDDCECECMGDCDCTCEVETREQMLFGDSVVPDSEIQEFSRIGYADIEKLENDFDKEFVRNYYNYADKWDTWTPESPLEYSLFNAVNQIA